MVCERFRTVGIVGGGTAGYLTALALRKHHPHLRVTLIESPEIPVIGVGEATTPLIVKFLHSFLGKDPWELFERADVTWKLGIRFDWGRPAPYSFNYAFDSGNVLDGLHYANDLDSYSLGSVLMGANRVPIVRDGPRLTSLLDKVALAYHIDNEKFVRWLREEALKDGVVRVEQTVREVRPTADGGAVDHLLLDDGRGLSFDLYVDCSGFRASLIEGALGSPFVSYDSSLATDTAVVANVPHGGVIKPYTVAETMGAGWCWNIPTIESDHRGYVFASAALDAGAAEEEMRRKNPGMGAVLRTVKFRSGRHEHFWKGNVVAIGNSYGFVEPLESTGIHMIVHEINQLVMNLPEHTGDEAVKRVVNRKLNAHWDEIRWFLAIHYRFNGRLETPFWQMCRSETDYSGAEERVALFRERAPLTYRQSLFWTPEQIFTDFAYDVMLLGQGVEAQRLAPKQNRRDWKQRGDAFRQVAGQALSQAEAFEVLRRSPKEILRSMVTNPGTWASWP